MNGPLAADKTVTNLDEDDKELVELLRELKSDQQEENSQKADSSNSSQTSRNSQKIPSQTKSIGSKNSQKKWFECRFVNFVPAPKSNVQGKVWKWSQWDFGND